MSLSPGKLKHLKALSNKNGIIAEGNSLTVHSGTSGEGRASVEVSGGTEVLADAETFGVTLVSVRARRCRDGESR